MQRKSKNQIEISFQHEHVGWVNSVDVSYSTLAETLLCPLVAWLQYGMWALKDDSITFLLIGERSE